MDQRDFGEALTIVSNKISELAPILEEGIKRRKDAVEGRDTKGYSDARYAYFNSVFELKRFMKDLTFLKWDTTFEDDFVTNHPQ